MDIRVDTTWRTHGKRKRLQRALGPAGPLAVMDLWLAIAEQYPDGKMPDCDAQDIADMAQWRGRNAELFVSVLCDDRTRFLDPLPSGGWQAHNWELRQSWVVSSPKRHLRAVRAASARWDDKPEHKTDATSNAKSINKHCTPHAQSNAPLLSSPLPSLPIQKKEEDTPPAGAGTPKGEAVGGTFTLSGRSDKPRGGFKTWTREQFIADCENANRDNRLTARELNDFIEYWMEPSSSGRAKFTLQDTWDTGRRMGTAIQRIYEPQRKRSPDKRITFNVEAAK